MILVKTELGHRVMKDRSVALTARQRSAFIMIDGRRTVDEILQASQAAGVTPDDIVRLVQTGVAQEAAANLQAYAPTGAGELLPASDPVRGPLAGLQERFLTARPVASQLTNGLGLRGFRLNLAVEGTRNYEELLALAPKIRDAVGEEKFESLRRALKG
jgi:hypothetical protein